jgi:hypothetical protein
MYPPHNTIDSWISKFLVHQFEEYRFSKVSSMSDADIVFVELKDWLREQMVQDLAEGQRARSAMGYSIKQVTIAWTGECQELDFYTDIFPFD